MAATQYATFEDRDEIAKVIQAPMSGTLNGHEISGPYYESIERTATEIKAWTLPHDEVQVVTYDMLGLSGSTNITFRVTDVEQFEHKCLLGIRVTLTVVEEGTVHTFEFQDNGGKELVLANGVTMWALHESPELGIVLTNKVGDYSDPDPQNHTPPEFIPGYLYSVGLDVDVWDDLRENPIDDSVFEVSKVANNFRTNGTEKTYTRTAAQTDWGVGYTATYWERTIGGNKVGMMDPQTIPEELLNQHGYLRRLTGR